MLHRRHQCCTGDINVASATSMLHRLHQCCTGDIHAFTGDIHAAQATFMLHWRHPCCTGEVHAAPATSMPFSFYAIGKEVLSNEIKLAQTVFHNCMTFLTMRMLRRRLYLTTPFDVKPQKAGAWIPEQHVE